MKLFWTCVQNEQESIYYTIDTLCIFGWVRVRVKVSIKVNNTATIYKAK